MKKKKICFIAQFPPPIHGLSKAVDTLYNSHLQQEFEFEKINITNNKVFIKNLICILKSKADLFYFTISQTKGGNIRDLIIFKILEFKKKKCLIHLHGGYYRKLIDNNLSSWQKRLNYKAVSKLTGAIVLGNSLKYIFNDILPDNKIFIVPNCVDNDFLISDIEFNNKITKLKNISVMHILYLSNFIKEKGYRIVLQLAEYEKILCNNGKKKSFHFDFAGNFFDNTEKDFFFNYIKDHNLSQYITYHGIVAGDKKTELLKNSNAFILLTRYPNEGQPISILEAMGNGMAIITTDHAGIPDIVKDGINGIVFNDNSEKNIEFVYNRINSLFNNDYITILQNNRNIVLNNYTEKAYIENIKNLFIKK